MAGEVDAEYAGGKMGATSYGKVARVDFGPLRLEQVPTSSIDLRPTRSRVFPGLEVKGIIGTGLLSRFLATIDYRQGRLILRLPDTVPPEQAKTRTIPFWMVETHLLFVRGQLNDLEPSLLFVDTGLADAGFLASQRVCDRAGIAVDWSKAKVGAGGGGETRGANISIHRVKLGDGVDAVTRTDLRGVVLEKDLSLFDGALGFDVGGLVSHQFFRDSAITFDFRRMRLLITR
jgi:hypothetical protein